LQICRIGKIKYVTHFYLYYIIVMFKQDAPSDQWMADIFILFRWENLLDTIPPIEVESQNSS